MHGAQRQAIKVAANCCRNNRCNTPRWVKVEQAKHEAYLPLSSKTRREIKARDTSSKHLKVTRTFNWENQGRQTAIATRHPAKKRLLMSALPSQRSTQHPPSIASPAPPCSGERNASTPVDYGYQRRRTSGKTLGKTRCHAKTVGHGTVSNETATTPHMCAKVRTIVSNSTANRDKARQATKVSFSTRSRV